MSGGDAERWEEWWKARLSKGRAGLYPMLPAPLLRVGERLFGVANTDNLLVHVMREHGLRTILCAGNGISQEPRALAGAGFDVTALDISPVSVRFAETASVDPRPLGRLCSPRLHRPGGRVSFIVGDLLDAAVCPGPFDVVVERCTDQVFAEHDRGAALSALSRRRGEVGIFLSLCLDDPFPCDLGWSQHSSGLFHASEAWFREHGRLIWDGLPPSALAGRVAWLMRAGTMKRRPRE